MLYTLGKELDHTLKKTPKNVYKFTCKVEVVEVYVCVCVCVGMHLHTSHMNILPNIRCHLNMYVYIHIDMCITDLVLCDESLEGVSLNSLAVPLSRFVHSKSSCGSQDLSPVATQVKKSNLAGTKHRSSVVV